MQGKGFYAAFCSPCHGGNFDGKGPAARGFNPPPANFSDPTTIAMLQESYLFWRIKKGGVGLPDRGDAMEIRDASLGSRTAGRMDLENHPGRVRWRASIPQNVGINTRLDEAHMIRVMQRHMKESAHCGSHCRIAGGGNGVQLCPGKRGRPGSMVKDALPIDDPNAAVWTSAPQAQFPMSPQVHWQNRIQEATVKDLKVRALHDGTQVAMFLEYADPTEDPDDAAAFEFMVGDKKAHFAHGQPMAQVEGGPVNIWFWKNKDGKGVDMNAKGFGTLKTQDAPGRESQRRLCQWNVESRLFPQSDDRTSGRRHAIEAR